MTAPQARAGAAATAAPAPRLSPTSRAFWFGRPLQARDYLGQVLPVVLTHLLIRLFHITDLRLVGGLGEDIRLAHAVQYNFMVLGQFIGAAGMTTMITLWSRTPGPERASLMGRVARLTLALSGAALTGILALRAPLLAHFSLSGDGAAGWYVTLGAVNMGLLAWQLSLDGALLAARRQVVTLVNTAVLLCGNLATDLLAVRAFQTGLLAKQPAAVLFISGTTLWLAAGIVISTLILRTEWPKAAAEAGGGDGPKALDSVWGNEVVISLSRALAPLWFAYQLGSLRSAGAFLVTYQAALHLAYIAALPLQGGLPVAIRECSREASGAASRDGRWLRQAVLLSLAPSLALYLAAMAAGHLLVPAVFKLALPSGHAAFFPLFFLGCAIGQVGHVVSVPLRAALKNRYIARCLIGSELLLNNLGVMVLIKLGAAEPRWLGALTVAYCAVFLAAMVASVRTAGEEAA